MRADQIVRRPIALTEKATRLSADAGGAQVIFEVNRDANKIQIREAIQTMFNVEVVSVNTLIMRGKERRMGRGHAKLQNWKKAIVTLKVGQAIDFFSTASSAE